MELDGKESERIVSRHEDSDGNAGIFDDLLVHPYFPAAAGLLIVDWTRDARQRSHSSATARLKTDQRWRGHAQGQLHNDLLSGFITIVGG